MMTKKEQRLRRSRQTRARIAIQRVARLTVFRSNLHIYAAMRGSLPMIELLLRNGADPLQATKEGDTPVELALRFGHAEVADGLKAARRAAAAGLPDTETPAPAPTQTA